MPLVTQATPAFRYKPSETIDGLLQVCISYAPFGIYWKPDKSQEEEPRTQCPYCSFQLSETELVCPECKNNLPYCIITGRHISREDITTCPKCEFPAILSEFLKLLESEEVCPMCSEKIDSQNLEKAKDLERILHPEEGADE
ncbi:hypothetical protein CAPTEDRAFT_224011 [Capitella teleta]|uniref:IFT121-like zinc finger domain-containing protein n=1 Tax=Capitella teleta TaxID=283909 RepID=R7UN23_CAPTE|nr:hypothetical protein CAPTEDRAFT_224011 [Capitella teleta]|eukprot:ELU04791.1 hypothetical protein CAPTEDRAFT_224011 [Capitella teleta]